MSETLNTYLQLCSKKNPQKFYHTYFCALVSVDTWSYVQKNILPNVLSNAPEKEKALLTQINAIISRLPVQKNIYVPINQIDSAAVPKNIQRWIERIKDNYEGADTPEGLREYLKSYPYQEATSAYCILESTGLRTRQQNDSADPDIEALRPPANTDFTALARDMQFLKQHWSLVQSMVSLLPKMHVELTPDFGFLRYAPDAQCAPDPQFHTHFIETESWAVLVHGGFLDANGTYGPLNLAKIFDSKERAQRSARATGLSSYDLVGVHVSLKCPVSPSTATGQEILSYMEKIQIQQSLAKPTAPESTKKPSGKRRI